MKSILCKFELNNDGLKIPISSVAHLKCLFHVRVCLIPHTHTVLIPNFIYWLAVRIVDEKYFT